MATIEFKPNYFYTFRALIGFHLGQFALNVRGDDTFEYDGSTMLYMGQSYAVPQLRTLLGKWYVPSTDNTTAYKAAPAGVTVRPAQSASEERGAAMPVQMATEEEAVVNTLDRSNARRAGQVAPPLPEQRYVQQQVPPSAPRLPVEDPHPVARTVARPQQPFPAAAVQNAPPRRTAAVTDEYGQEFVPVPPRQAQAPQPVYQAPQPQYQPPQAQYQPMMTAVAPGSLSQADIDAVNRANAANAARLAAALAQPIVKTGNMGGNRFESLEEEGQVVGRAGKFRVISADGGHQGEEIRSIPNSGGASVGREGEAQENVRGVSIFKETGDSILARQKPIGSGPNRATLVEQAPPTGPQPRQMMASATQVYADQDIQGMDYQDGFATGDVSVTMSGDDLPDLLPGAIVAGGTDIGAAPTVQDVVGNWDTSAHWMTRVTKAVDLYGDKPEILDAICQVEQPSVVKNIRAKLGNR